MHSSISKLLITKSLKPSNTNLINLIVTQTFSQRIPNELQTKSQTQTPSISNICSLVTQNYQEKMDAYSASFKSTPLCLNLDPSTLSQDQAMTIIAALSAQQGTMVALSFFNWVILHKKFRYFMRIYITTAAAFLKDNCNVDKANEVMRIMVMVFAEVNRFKDAVDMVLEMWSQRLRPNVFTLNVILGVSVDLRLVDYAENVFREMVGKRGVRPNYCSYKSMVIMHCRVGSSVSEVERWLEVMMGKRFMLDNVTCTMVVDVYCRNGSFEKVFGLFDRMSKSGVPPNVINYSVLVDRLCKRGNIKQAFEVLEEMVAKGWNPNVYTHTALIDGLCKKGWTDKAFRLFLKLVKSDIYKPNECTYTAMINGYCKEGKLNRAEMLWMKMIEQGLHPNIKTYTTMIDGYCKDSNITKAHDLLNRMMKVSIEPTISTYNSIVDGLFKKGRVDEAYKFLRNGFDQGLKADQITYTIVITNLCKHARTKCAMVLFYKMVKSGCLPDILIYTTLISAFCRKGRMKDSEMLFEKAVESGLVPTKQTFTSMICGYCRAGHADFALKIFQKMRDHGCAADAITYGALISGLCKESKIEEAHKLYSTMINKKVSPCEVTRLTLAYEYCRKDDSATAMNLLERLDVKLWVRTVNTLARKLCSEGKVEVAALFCHKLLDKKVNVDRVVLAGFFSACYGNNKYSVASDLADRISEGFIS